LSEGRNIYSTRIFETSSGGARGKKIYKCKGKVVLLHCMKRGVEV
jgi:hypothetical protein